MPNAVAWFLVIDAAGECRSMGTRVADPLPHGLSAIAIPAADAAAILSGAAAWSVQSRAVVAVPPPTPKEVSPWQLQTWLLQKKGVAPADIEGLLGALPGQARTQALIDWTKAATYRRDHHLIDQLGASLGMTPQDIDQAFREASQLQ